MTENSTHSLESMLRSIIEAQCAGGYQAFEFTPVVEVSFHPGSLTVWTHNKMGEGHARQLLDFLFDTRGLNAIWGTDFDDRTEYRDGVVVFRKINGDYAAHKILDSWLSGGADAAIKTAFTLLPKKP